jgi:hypothetical protein
LGVAGAGVRQDLDLGGGCGVLGGLHDGCIVRPADMIMLRLLVGSTSSMAMLSPDALIWPWASSVTSVIRDLAFS